MELDDCAFQTLNGIVATDDAEVAFKDIDYALLVGARPRGPGMERKDLLLANAQIFSAQGKALDAVANRNVQVLVVGNPANTNALIAQRERARTSIPRNFTAMMRLDHNRALAQLAEKTGAHVDATSSSVTIWGNHSATQYPGPRARDRRRQAGAVAASIRTGTRRRSSRPCSSAARRSSRRAARRRPRRPRRPRSITCATGRSARADGDWVSMGVAVRRQLRHHRKASSTAIRCRCARRRVPDRAGPRDRRVRTRQAGRHRQGAARRARGRRTTLI